MESKKYSLYQKCSFIILLCSLCALTSLFFLFLYEADNKYTTGTPQAIGGVLLLSESDLNKAPLMFLVDGWEYYNGKLLSPEDFMRGQPLPDAYIFIGQYGGLETGSAASPPHGSASYRLNIAVPDSTRQYMLAMPEIFSAYKIYINGHEALAMGNPEPSAYRPETGNKIITFEASKRIEILVAVSDFSHFYSGMVYPPAFGPPQTVFNFLNMRFLIRSIFCVIALTVGVLSIFIGIVSRKNITAALYGLMCLFFIGYVSYPITQTIVTGFYPLYAIESFSVCAMFLIVILLQSRICVIGSHFTRYFIALGGFVCFASVLLPFINSVGSLRIMFIYSKLIDLYMWATAAYITLTAAYAVVKSSVNSVALLCGILVFDCALVMDRLLPLYEPIITGWFPELASFVLLLCIGYVCAKDIGFQYRDNLVLAERASSMEKLAQMQQASYSVLREQIEETKAMHHDVRHHFLVIAAFIEDKRFEELRDYVIACQDPFLKCTPLRFSENEIINVLARHYTTLTNKYDIDLDMKLELPAVLPISDVDLCCIISNLLENAVEACRRQTSARRCIKLIIQRKKSTLIIRMQNSSDKTKTSEGFSFISSKAKDRIGYGLASIALTAQKYMGETEFSYDETAHIFHSMVLLTL